MKTISSLELLESRIAPASIVTLTDVNGDQVKFTSSKGDLTGHVVQEFTAPDGTHGIFYVDLDDAQFEGTNFTVSVLRKGGGDGHAIVGYLHAVDRHLGAVSIAADLGKFVAGPYGTPFTGNAVKSLAVDSIGRFGVFGISDAGYGPKNSVIGGGLGSLMVKGDLNDGLFEVHGLLASATIGGSIVGGAAGGGGELYAQELGKVVVKGDIRGANGKFSGSVISGHNIASITVGGSVVGGGGENSGDIMGAYVQAGRIGTLTIGGSLVDGRNDEAGAITSHAAGGGSLPLTIGTVTVGRDFSGAMTADSIDRVTIKGSLLGESNAGAIFATNRLGTIAISGDLRGGSAPFAASVYCGSIGTVTVGGSLIGGGSSLTGAIEAVTGLDRIMIGGSVVGGSASFSGAVEAMTIGSLTVAGSLIGGSVVHAGSIKADLSIGSVTVLGSVFGGSADSTGLIEAVNGAISSVKIAHDLRGGGGVFSGSVSAGTDLLSISVGGSVAGGSGDNSGDIFAAAKAAGRLDSLSIAGSLVGGIGEGSGTITNASVASAATTPLVLGKVTIGGSLRGGYGQASGTIRLPFPGSTLDQLTIKGSVYGASDYSGEIQVAGAAGSIAVGGSIYGSSATYAGSILALAGLHTLTIGGSVYGGSATYSGRAYVIGTLDTLMLRGDLRGGSADYAGSIHTDGITRRFVGGILAPASGAETGEIIG